jgi:hypothetical protein
VELVIAKVIVISPFHPISPPVANATNRMTDVVQAFINPLTAMDQREASGPKSPRPSVDDAKPMN